jgi:flavin-dependent dehydrogenase
MKSDHVHVVGAGPAGLAAAIELARHKVPVTVHEQHGNVGRRFHGDFQGFENWTTHDDVLLWLERLGITLDCPYRATDAITLVDPDMEVHRIETDRPLIYLIQRGPHAESLDQCLRRQAEALGVEIRFGARTDPAQLTGRVIVATGAQQTQAVVAGIVAETSHSDQITVIARDSLAPRCYAYCVIGGGRATVASALACEFSTAWQCFERARAAFASLGLTSFSRERRFGGRAAICLDRPLEQDGRLYVGEAAGLQDYLLGFGLRYALHSGHLAARAVLNDESYEALVRRHLYANFRAGFVNRFFYNHLGDRGYRSLIRWVSRAANVRERARRSYSFTAMHSVCWPLVRSLARRNGGSLTATTILNGWRGSWETRSSNLADPRRIP